VPPGATRATLGGELEQVKVDGEPDWVVAGDTDVSPPDSRHRRRNLPNLTVGPVSTDPHT
jgi:hypothetical protein